MTMSTNYRKIAKGLAEDAMKAMARGERDLAVKILERAAEYLRKAEAA